MNPCASCGGLASPERAPLANRSCALSLRGISCNLTHQTTCAARDAEAIGCCSLCGWWKESIFRGVATDRVKVPQWLQWHSHRVRSRVEFAAKANTPIEELQGMSEGCSQAHRTRVPVVLRTKDLTFSWREGFDPPTALREDGAACFMSHRLLPRIQIAQARNGFNLLLA